MKAWKLIPGKYSIASRGRIFLVKSYAQVIANKTRGEGWFGTEEGISPIEGNEGLLRRKGTNGSLYLGREGTTLGGRLLHEGGGSIHSTVLKQGGAGSLKLQVFKHLFTPSPRLIIGHRGGTFSARAYPRKFWTRSLPSKEE